MGVLLNPPVPASTLASLVNAATSLALVGPGGRGRLVVGYLHWHNL